MKALDCIPRAESPPIFRDAITGREEPKERRSRRPDSH